VFALWPLTEAGRLLAVDIETMAVERFAEESGATRNDRRRALINQADTAARVLLQSAMLGLEAAS
jgi:hypothetical protein